MLYLTSYSGGPTAPAGDSTGSPLTQTACTTCHQGGNFDPTTEISLLDQGAEVTAYEPGKTYTLRLSTTAQNNPSGYGFQAVVHDSADENAGTFGTPPAAFRVATSGSRMFFEQTRIQPEPTVEIDWTAPATGTGEVTVYVGANAINAGGSTAGDNATLTELTIVEGGPSSTADVNASEEFKAYQTSASTLALELGEELAFPVQYTIQDMSGRTLQAAIAVATENSVAVTAGAPQVVLVVIRDANGRTGAKQIALR